MEWKPTIYCLKCSTAPCEDCKPKRKPFFTGYKPQFYFRTVLTHNTSPDFLEWCNKQYFETTELPNEA